MGERLRRQGIISFPSLGMLDDQLLFQHLMSTKIAGVIQDSSPSYWARIFIRKQKKNSR